MRISSVLCSSFPSKRTERRDLGGRASARARPTDPAPTVTAWSLPATGRFTGTVLLVCVLLSMLSSDTVYSQATASGHRMVSPENPRPASDLNSAILGIDQRTWFGTDIRMRHPQSRLPRTVPARTVPDDHSPRGALWRSAVLPGWGQIYNRQYVKLPFVYGALGGLVAAIIRLDADYDLYNRAFQYKAFQELVDAGQLEENPRASFRSSYDRIADDVGPVSSRPLEIRRNNLRRGRDLSAIGLGLVYGLAMLDAYVSAHLLNFDVGESLGVDMTPGIDGVRISARVTL